MKRLFTSVFALISSAAMAADAPKPLTEFLPPNILVNADLVMVVPPQEIDKYVVRIKEAALKDPEWYEANQKKVKAGVPPPYDEKLGLTREEYDDYMKLWEKREFKPVEHVVLQLKQADDGKTWNIQAFGTASDISLLTYNVADDTFKSFNGILKRSTDIDADPASTLRAWKGHEWKLEDDSDSLRSTRENFGVGKTADGKYGLILYRMQQRTSAGSLLLDNGMVIRFLLGEAGYYKPTPPPSAAGAPASGDPGSAATTSKPTPPASSGSSKPKKGK